MSSSAVAYAQENHPRFLNELKALLRIPSVSTTPDMLPTAAGPRRC